MSNFSIQFLNFTFKPIEPLIDNAFQCINLIIDTIDLHRLKNPTVNRSKCDRPGSKRQCRDRTTVKPIVHRSNAIAFTAIGVRKGRSLLLTAIVFYTSGGCNPRSLNTCRKFTTPSRLVCKRRTVARPIAVVPNMVIVSSLQVK